MDASRTRADSTRRPRYLDVGWVLLLILGLFFLAAITYTLTFGGHDSTILARSLVAVMGLPILLLIQVPRFYGRRVTDIR